MSLQRLRRRHMAPPPVGKLPSYYRGWMYAGAEWWLFFKPKRGVFQHRLDQSNHKYLYLKKVPKR